MVKLKEIYFGDVEGKDEFLEVKDNFTGMFYKDSEIFKKLYDPKVFLIIGRKGTGKTLLAEYYKHITQSETNKVNIFDESDFSLMKLRNFEYGLVSDQESRIFWEYFFLTTIAEQIVKDTKIKRIGFMVKRRKLRSILDKSDFKVSGKTVKESNSMGFNITGGIKNISSKISGNLSEEVSKQFQEKKYYERIDSLRKLVMFFISNGKVNYQLFFDDIDELEVFNDDSSQKIKFIHSMIKAAKRMNNDFRTVDSNSKIFVLMRVDMIKELNQRTHNFNKVRQTNSVTLDWQYNSSTDLMDQPLTRMIIKKIKNNSPDYRLRSDFEIFNLIWPQKIANKNAIKYIIDHSFGRPRDFVMFLNVVKVKYPEKESITGRMMKQSLNEYSSIFFDELTNEINRNENRDLIMDTITLIKDTGKNTFHLDELMDTYELTPERYHYITGESDLKLAIESLYQYSVIGASKKVKTGKSSYRLVEFFYRTNAIDTPNLLGGFSIHFALRPALNIGDSNIQKETVA